MVQRDLINCLPLYMVDIPLVSSKCTFLYYLFGKKKIMKTEMLWDNLSYAVQRTLYLAQGFTVN